MLSRLARVVDAAALPVVCGLLVALMVVAAFAAFTDRREPRGEPVVTTSFFVERDGVNPTGRVCTQLLARSGSDVAVSLSCAWPPAESRIADLLEGAGQ